MVSAGSNKSDSESNPIIPPELLPYLTSGQVGPTQRYQPMEFSPEWQEWNRRVSQGLEFGPPPAMIAGEGGNYQNIGGETMGGNNAIANPPLPAEPPPASIWEDESKGYGFADPYTGHFNEFANPFGLLGNKEAGRYWLARGDR